MEHLSYPPYIKTLITKKRKLRKKWQQSRSPGDKNILNNATQHLRREIQKLKNKNFNKYLSELSYDNKTDYSLWKATKQFKRPVEQKCAVRNTEGNYAKSNIEKANMFAEYLETILNKDRDQNSQIMQETVNNDGENIPHVTVDEVNNEIKQLVNKKSSGYDLIRADLLKNLPNNGQILLTTLFNSAISLQYFPIHWKVAEIIMILKPGKNSYDVSSYRPISLLPVIGKLFEKIICRRLNSVIETRNLIPHHQFGFRKKHSTLEQVHRISHEIERTIECKEICSAVFLDVSKAFDAVWHPGLHYKLNERLPKSYCNLLKSYLSDRFFRVKVENNFSTLHPITTGVPQGSILGPILYLIFTCDLPINPDCFVGTFADDTVIMSSGKNSSLVTEKLQTALNQVVQWTKKWNITLNSSKSTHVYFTNRSINKNPIYIDATQVPIANSAKYLGMTLDAKLKWKEHVKKKHEELKLKNRKLTWLIGRKSTLPLQNKLMVYNQILKPVWTYGIQLWGCASNDTLDIIQRFQNKVLRDMVRAPWFIRNSDLHRDLKVNTVRQEVQYFAKQHKQKLEEHSNELIPQLLDSNQIPRRLNRIQPLDLMRRFTQQGDL